MEWIHVSDNLPVQKTEGWPTWDWVLVTSQRYGTNEPWPFTIARYTNKGWDLWDEKQDCCPCFGDTAGGLSVDEITHWMPLKPPAYFVETATITNKEIEEEMKKMPRL